MSEPCYPHQPAISIPWYSGRHLIAIRYRFLKSHIYTDLDGNLRDGGKGDGKGKGVKMRALWGSDFAGHIFGGHALVYHSAPEAGRPDVLALRTLVLTEGEINGMSVWQVANTTGLDVLSLGSESSDVPDTVAAYARRYGAVMVWADEEKIAQKWEQQIGRPVHYITSAMCTKDGEKKRDANALLQEGKLGFYLTTWRTQFATDKERLLWNLVEADGERYLLDDGTRHAMHKLAAQLGKSGIVTE